MSWKVLLFETFYYLLLYGAPLIAAGAAVAWSVAWMLARRGTTVVGETFLLVWAALLATTSALLYLTGSDLLVFETQNAALMCGDGFGCESDFHFSAAKGTLLAAVVAAAAFAWRGCRRVSAGPRTT